MRIKFLWGNIAMLWVVALAINIILITLGMNPILAYIVSFITSFLFPFQLIEINHDKK